MSLTWSMAAILRDSVAVTVFVRTHPRAIPNPFMGFFFFPTCVWGSAWPLGYYRSNELKFRLFFFSHLKATKCYAEIFLSELWKLGVNKVKSTKTNYGFTKTFPKWPLTLMKRMELRLCFVTSLQTFLKLTNIIHLLFFSIEPAEELVQVNELVYGFLVPTFNDTFRTTVSWQKPKFTHSNVDYYKYKVLPIDSSQRERRRIAMNTEITTVRIITLNLLLTNY